MNNDEKMKLVKVEELVRQLSFDLGKDLDEGRVYHALSSASEMVTILDNSDVSLQGYFELYMEVFDGLDKLKRGLHGLFKREHKWERMYEVVQYNPKLLPRLYLLITIGSVYILVYNERAISIITDLIELVKGVQHPVKGLFLRYYLNKMFKDKLPQDSHEDLLKSIEFLVKNLTEMNKLWTRVGPAKSNLKMTMGENIVRLSSLENINAEMYRDNVLSRIIEVVHSSDQQCQLYLLDCVVQAFPIGCHLNTLNLLTEAFTQVKTVSGVKSIAITLLKKLTEYAEDSEIQGLNIDIYKRTRGYIDEIVQTGETMDNLRLITAYLRFTFRAYPGNNEMIDVILESCLGVVEPSNKNQQLEKSVRKVLFKMLMSIVNRQCGSVVGVDSFPRVMTLLDDTLIRETAGKILEKTVCAQVAIDTEEKLISLLRLISLLLVGDTDLQLVYCIAKLVYLVRTHNKEMHLGLLGILFEAFNVAGVRKIKLAYLSLSFAYIQLLESRNGLVFFYTVSNRLNQIIGEFMGVDPYLGLKLNLECLQIVDKLIENDDNLETSLNALKAKSFSLYILIREPTMQFESLLCIIAIISRMRSFQVENLDYFISKSMKRLNQCKVLLHFPSLYWNYTRKEGTKVVHYLKQSLKLAELCSIQPNGLELYVQILNAFLLYSNEKLINITPSTIPSLIALIEDLFIRLGHKTEVKRSIGKARTYFANTLNYIKTRT